MQSEKPIIYFTQLLQLTTLEVFSLEIDHSYLAELSHSTPFKLNCNHFRLNRGYICCQNRLSLLDLLIMYANVWVVLVKQTTSRRTGRIFI